MNQIFTKVWLPTKGNPAERTSGIQDSMITKCVTLLLELNSMKTFPWHEIYESSNTCHIVVLRTQIFVIGKGTNSIT